VTFVDRQTRCILSWAVAFRVDEDVVQGALDHVPQARWYYSDAAPVYDGLHYYPGHHMPMHDKSQTYSVEADNAELRHYLARLARKSRCFSRSIDALCAAVQLFVFCWNQRQLYKQRYPNYPAHLIDFLPIPC
jgi:insertion element IS1 protein InsB